MKHFVLLLGMLFSLTVFSQKTTFEEMLNRSLEEKIKVDLNNPQKGWKQDKKIRQLKGLKSTNVVISGDNTAESEVHAAINPNDSNQIVVSPIAHSGMAGLNCPVYYSNDFGANWNNSSFTNMPSLPGNMSVGGGDPVFVYDDGNRVYFSWIDLSIKNMNLDNAYWGMYWAYSDDNGQTWNYDTTQVIEESQGSLNNIAAFNGPLTDKQWMAADINPSSPHYNDIYISYVEIDIQSQAYRVTVARKPSDSTHFDTTKAYLTDTSFAIVQFGSISVGQSGRVHVSFFGSRDGSNYGIYHCYSDDGAKNFTAPLKVSDIQIPQFSANQLNVSVEGISDDRLYPSVYNASSSNSNHVYITWTANGLMQKDSDGLDIYFSRSTDGGNTFEAPVIINDDTNKTIHQYYSAINVSPHGRVDISWYDRRADDSLNINTHYYINSSYDNGQTFGQNTRITGMATDFSTVGNLNNEFGVGEYNAVLSTNDYIIPVWADGRKNSGDLDIYAAFVNKNSLSVERLTSMNKDFTITQLFPNPASEMITCRLSAKKNQVINIAVLDMSGKKLLEKNDVRMAPGENELSLKINHLSSGIYFLKFYNENGLETRKLIIR
ncbi:MAG: T9SS type A sorting domain-containing protein [Bacteroidales bacterium]|nr:T9SS type A sorting domain-containing protein [Bacteroidales bacterium]